MLPVRYKLCFGILFAMNFVFVRLHSFTVMHGYHHWQTGDKIIQLRMHLFTCLFIYFLI